MFNIYNSIDYDNTKGCLAHKRCALGWTLIELLIVLVMLSVLMTLVLPQVSLVLYKGQRMAAQQLLLESLSMVQLRGTLSLDASCATVYQQNRARFIALDMTLYCRRTAPDEIFIIGALKAGAEYQLSSRHGFLEEL